MWSLDDNALSDLLTGMHFSSLEGCENSSEFVDTLDFDGSFKSEMCKSWQIKYHKNDNY